MEDNRFQISADGTRATFEVQADGAGLTLTAPEIEAAIAILGDARRQMSPPVPSDPAPPWERDHERTQGVRLSVMGNGTHVGLYLRSERLGWTGFSVSITEARQLARDILNVSGAPAAGTSVQ